MTGHPIDNLGKTWEEFCDRLKAAGGWILQPDCPDDALDRAEGFRLLTRLLRGACEQFVEFDDPLHPQLTRICHETIKVIAENPDNIYLVARIDGRHEYRVWGTRGCVRWLSFNTHAGAFGAGGRGTAAALDGNDLQVEPDGRFELWLGGQPRSGNWLRLDPDVTTFVVRQTRADWKNEVPADLHIERVGAQVLPAPLDPAQLDRALNRVGHYLHGITRMAVEWSNASARHPNQFVDVQSQETRAYKDPNIAFHMAYWVLESDQALIVEAHPPRCDYWMFILHNHWLESLDYRFHRIHLNTHTAHLESDGSVRVIVAHRDPGVPNWLDTAGHRCGTIGVRWVGPNVTDVMPTSRVVPLSSLRAGDARPTPS